MLQPHFARFKIKRSLYIPSFFIYNVMTNETNIIKFINALMIFACGCYELSLFWTGNVNISWFSKGRNHLTLIIFLMFHFIIQKISVLLHIFFKILDCKYSCRRDTEKWSKLEMPFFTVVLGLRTIRTNKLWQINNIKVYINRQMTFILLFIEVQTFW